MEEAAWLGGSRGTWESSWQCPGTLSPEQEPPEGSKDLFPTPEGSPHSFQIHFGSCSLRGETEAGGGEGANKSCDPLRKSLVTDGREGARELRGTLPQQGDPHTSPIVWQGKPETQLGLSCALKGFVAVG